MDKNERQNRTFQRQAKRGLRSRNRRRWLMWAKTTGQLENYYYQKRFGMSKQAVLRSLREKMALENQKKIQQRSLWQKIFIWFSKLFYKIWKK